MTRIKLNYIGKAYPDGWGCRPAMTGYETLDGAPDCGREAAERAFEGMLGECGELAATLVHPGEEDHTTVRINQG